MAELVKDVVCGMEIDPDTAAGKSDYQGTTYYFCAVGCKQDFDADPQKFLGNGGAPAAEAAPVASSPSDAPPKRWWEFWK